MSGPELRLVMLLVTGALSTSAVAQQATVAQGQQIAAQGTQQGVAACIGCHGAKGEGSAVSPRLAGTGRAYLQAQLEAFAGGSRKNPIMQPFAQRLSSTERIALAMYYSQMKAPFSATDVTSPTPVDPGAWLATRGRWDDQLPACAQCHGPSGSGVGAEFPPLAGLSAIYITEQLQAWKAGTRPPGPLSLMPMIASKLADKDINAVATYYAGLTVSQEAAQATAQTLSKRMQSDDKKRGLP